MPELKCFTRFAGFVFLVAAARGEADGACSTVAFSAPIVVGAGSLQAIGDLTGDGLPDALLWRADSLVLLVNEGSGRFRETDAIEYGLPVLGRFDGPSKSLGIARFRGFEVDLVRVSPAGRFEIGSASPPARGASRATAADLDGDGRSELVFLTGSLLRSLVLGDGGGTLRDLAVVDVPAPSRLLTGDFDGDERQDVLVVGYENRTPSVANTALYLGRADGGLSRSAAFTLPRADDAFVGDFDEDGRTDFAIQGLTLTATSHWFTNVLLMGDADAGLRGAPSWKGRLSPHRDFFGDFDGDGHLDVLEADELGLFSRLFRGDGRGGFAIDESTSPVPVGTVADVDGNGLADILATANRYGVETLEVHLNACASTEGPPYFLPALVEVSPYGTEIVLANASDAPMLLLVRFPTVWGAAGRLDLAAGEARVFATPERLAGALRPKLPSLFLGAAAPAEIHVLTGKASGLAGYARVSSPSGAGRAGVALPLAGPSKTSSSTAAVPWLVEDGRDRSNLAVLHAGSPGAARLRLRVTVTSTDPAHPGSRVLSELDLIPGARVQMDRVLARAGLQATSGWALVERLAGESAFHAYGVVNDERTNDGSVVSAFDPTEPQGARLVVPVVVASDRYRSDLVAFNRGPGTRRIRARLGSDEVVLDVAPDGHVRIEDVVSAFGRPAGAGALFLEVEGGSSKGVFVAVRTSSTGSPDRYGVFYEALPVDRLPSGVATVAGLLQGGLDRSNVALVNAGERGRFRLTALDASGTPRGSIEQELGPEEWRQFDGVLFSLAGGATAGSVRIERVSGTGAFLAYGVVNDGTGPGAGTGDGTFVSMTVP